MMKNALLLVSLFFYSLSFSQDLEIYNKIYTKTYLETAHTDFKSALKTADSLYTISETPLLKTRSLMLSASLYKQSGEVKKSVDYALQSAEIIGQTDNYSWQAKVYGFLGTQYRLLQLHDYSKKYLDKALEISDKIENPKSANNLKGLMFQEKAYNQIDQKKYKIAIQNVRQAQKHFNLAEANLDFFTANNEQLLGLSYYKLEDLDQSLIHYKKALEFTKADPENFIVGLIYNGFANIYIDRKDLKEAKKYLILAEKICNKSDYLALKKEFNETSTKFYTLTNDVEKVLIVQKKQDSVVEKINLETSDFINKSFNSLETTNKISEEKNHTKTIIIVVCGLLFVLGAVYFILSKRRHKRNLEDFKKLLKDLDEKLNEKNKYISQLDSDKIKVSEAVSDCSKTESSAMMNEETERKLLLKLQEFEASTLFLENTISLSSLSTYCQTNSKYLSYIINTYQKKDFNNYINELRINYIVKKLKDFPIYRKYKMAVLSEEAGFSSQNKFSTVFKKIMTMSPSVFIAYLQEIEK
ncbi:hypothetical protein HY04_11345 [Kaistella antarctica]|uniref:HTH araC/xylS-type domain-containing protein n=2 Tax=Kaistella antarctica TaxID=266748 RepID=A0ABR4TYT6_9FLAO|nr:hypothetical protein HY04_11345 [Kaistella antarctica]